MVWLALSEEEKKQVIDFLNSKLNKNKPDMFVETGEPMYLDENLNMYDISEVISGVWLQNINKQ